MTFRGLLSVLREACFSINRNKCSWNHLKGRQREERHGLLSLVTSNEFMWDLGIFNWLKNLFGDPSLKATEFSSVVRCAGPNTYGRSELQMFM